MVAWCTKERAKAAYIAWIADVAISDHFDEACDTSLHSATVEPLTPVCCTERQQVRS
jgi:hypothetical protein